MKKLLLLILLLGFGTVGRSQIIEKNIKYEIIDSYIKHHEVLLSNKQKIYHAFNNYFTIKELINKSHFKNGIKGIYSISCGITSTSRMLFFYNNNRSYYVIPTDSLNMVLARFISYVKTDKNLNKLDIIKYLENILEISDDNIALDKMFIIQTEIPSKDSI